MKSFFYLLPLFGAALVNAQAGPEDLELDQEVTILEARTDGLSFDKNCNDDKQKVINLERKYAIQMAHHAQTNLTKERFKGYYQDFFAKDLRDNKDFAGQTKKRFENVRTLLRGKASSYSLKITCDNDSDKCKSKKNEWYVHMDDGKKTMNFCNRFFDDNLSDDKIKSTKERLSHCKDLTLRTTARSRAAIILHEAATTEYAMGGGDKGA